MLVASVMLFALGCLHALGPDHLAAIAALSARGREPAVWVGAKFGGAHAAVLMVAGAVAATASATLPAGVAAAAGRIGGVLLAGMGTATVWAAISRTFVVHRHAHTHEGEAHDHVHAHLVSRKPGALERHVHRHGAWVLGAIFGASGLRAVAVMVPAVAAGGALRGPSSFGPWGDTASAVVPGLAFGLGVAVAMSAFGLLAGAAMSLLRRTERTWRAAQALAGVCGVALGTAFLVGALE